MTVYVDAIRNHDLRGKPAHIQEVFAEGSCHMWTDGPLEELHDMASRIGMSRKWLQNDSVLPHYQLTPTRRERALRNGAQEGSRKKLAECITARRLKERRA